MTSQDLIAAMDPAGARFTVLANDDDAIKEAVATWLQRQSVPKRVVLEGSIAVLASGDVTCNGQTLSDDDLTDFVKYALAEWH